MSRVWVRAHVVRVTNGRTAVAKLRDQFRKLFKGLALAGGFVSALTAIGIAALNYRSFDTADTFTSYTYSAMGTGLKVRTVGAWSQSGRISITVSNHGYVQQFIPAPLPADGYHYSSQPAYIPVALMNKGAWLGFMWFWNSSMTPIGGKNMQTYSLQVFAPHWFYGCLLSIRSILWLFSAVRKRRTVRRALSQLCVHCGYDLRASPERCPECGRVFASRDNRPLTA